MTEEQLRLRMFCPECGEDFEEGLQTCPTDGTRLQALSMPDAPEDDPLIGTELDERFLLEGVLGEGGMGRVYRGVQLSVDRDVAVKVLRSEIGKDDTIIKRFFREANVISNFTHPNIVNLVEFGQDPKRDLLYLAMEYIDGDGLGELLEQGRLDPALVVEIGMQVASALSEPHAEGVIHRDLKPENLMLIVLTDGRIQVKVVDFGIAFSLQETQKLTQTGAVFGTPHYMGPEQATGDEVDARTDIYSLGVILYEMLSGTPPFDGETSLKILFKHVQDPPPPLSSFIDPEKVPGALVDLINDMMAKAPEDRPQTALEVRRRLESIRTDHGFQTPSLDPQAPTQGRFDRWLLPPSEKASRLGTDSSPPMTDPGAPTPSTGDIDPVGATAPARPASDDPNAKPRRDETTAPSVAETDPSPASSGRSPYLWLGVGAGAALALIAGSVILWLVIMPADENAAPETGAKTPPTEASADEGDKSADDRGDEAVTGAEGSTETSPTNDPPEPTARENPPKKKDKKAPGSESSEPEARAEPVQTGSVDKPDDVPATDEKAAADRAAESDSAPSVNEKDQKDEESGSAEEPAEVEPSDPKPEPSVEDEIAIPEKFRDSPSEDGADEKSDDSESGGFHPVE